MDDSDYKYLGDFSATPPWHSRAMSCDRCRVKWTGCWDNFQCPKCGEGELPSNEIEPTKAEVKAWYAKYVVWFRARMKKVSA